MKKLFLLGFLLICLVAAGAYLGYGWVTHGSILGYYQIQTDGSRPQNYPFIAWDDVVSGKLQQFLDKQNKAGKLLKLPDTVQPVGKFRGSGNGYFQARHILYPILDDADVQSGIYTDPAKRPYRFVAFFRTELNKEQYYLLIQEWRNSDGTASFLPLLEPVRIAMNGTAMTDYYRSVIDPSAMYFLSPILVHDTRDWCLTVMGEVGAYCNWYFADQGRVDKYQELMNNWVDGGRVPGEVSRYPAIFTRSQITNK